MPEPAAGRDAGLSRLRSMRNGCAGDDVIFPMRKMRIALSAVACLALAACGQTGTTGGSTPSPTFSGGPPVSGSPTPPGPSNPATPSPVPGKSTPPRPPGSPKPPGTMTLSGTITAGVEPNCVLLDNYLLVGGPRELLKAGARVTVTGRVQADLMTTCQQGTPFMVESAKPA